MNQDIIRIAGEAGFVIDEVAQQHQPNCVFHTHHMIDEQLTRFAALVAAAEREACAKVCDAIEEAYRCQESIRHPALKTDAETGSEECAAAIRARSKT